MEHDFSTDVAAAVQAGIDTANAGTRVTKIEGGVPFALVQSDMKVESLVRTLEEADKRADRPRRRMGIAVLSEVDSFIAHVNRFKDGDSAIFADIDKVKLTAVLDYHEKGKAMVGQGASDAAGRARWGQHRSVYSCPLSRQWQTWIASNDKAMTQDQFGDFIEANMKDLANPNAEGAMDEGVAAPAAVLQMARELVVRTKGEFSRSVNVTTGEYALVSKLENDTTSTKIPRAFVIGIPVFESGDLYRVEARVRMHVKDARAYFSYSLFGADDVLRFAFGGVRKRVVDETALPLFAGQPE